MGFASYLENIREFAEQRAGRHGSPAPNHVQRSLKWTPHYRAAKVPKKKRDHFEEAEARLTPEERQILRGLFDAAHEFVGAQSDLIGCLFDKGRRTDARQRFDKAHSALRQHIRHFHLHVLGLIFQQGRRPNDIPSLYIVQELIKTNEGIETAFTEDMQALEAALDKFLKP